MNTNNTLEICLATYNGAKWIQEFLDSLDAQTYTDWRLVVSDDASKDGTLEIIRTHFTDTPEKLSIVPRERSGMGVVQNFHDAIEASISEYILLADQDDVWMPEKLVELLAVMRKTEQDSKAPTLVFSDLEVVDEQLITLNKSWWKHTAIKPSWALSFRVMLSQNIVPGCAMMINRSLLDIAMPIPRGAVMHDWWYLLVALVFGNVGYSPKQLVRYRRHVEAHTNWEKGSLASTLLRQLRGAEIMRKDYAKTIIQSEAFELRFEKNMGSSVNERADLQALKNYIQTSKNGWWKKRLFFIKNRVHLISILQTTKFYMWI